MNLYSVAVKWALIVVGKAELTFYQVTGVATDMIQVSP
jgi:hypothetical protein